MSLIPASQKSLFEESMLNNTLEERGFLEPLDSVSGIRHIGWFSDVEPVFQLCGERSARDVAVAIADMARNGELESAGLRGFVVPESVSVGSIDDLFSVAVVIIKVENWWDNCLPNGILNDQAAINSHIREREQEMSERLQSKFSNGCFEIDDHSVFGGSYGQYQFVGWER